MTKGSHVRRQKQLHVQSIWCFLLISLFQNFKNMHTPSYLLTFLWEQNWALWEEASLDKKLRPIRLVQAGSWQQIGTAWRQYLDEGSTWMKTTPGWRGSITHLPITSQGQIEHWALVINTLQTTCICPYMTWDRGRVHLHFCGWFGAAVRLRGEQHPGCPQFKVKPLTCRFRGPAALIYWSWLFVM